EITFHPLAIQQYADALSRIAHVCQRRWIACIMTNNPAAPGKLPPQHAFNFFETIATVSSSSNENRHVLEPYAHFRKQRFKHRLPRLRAGDVANRDGNLLARPDNFSQRRFAHWSSQSGNERGALIRCRRYVHRL